MFTKNRFELINEIGRNHYNYRNPYGYKDGYELSNLYEYDNGPHLFDTDHDGIADGAELRYWNVTRGLDMDTAIAYCRNPDVDRDNIPGGKEKSPAYWQQLQHLLGMLHVWEVSKWQKNFIIFISRENTNP